MNRLSGEITNIEVSGTLSIVSVLVTESITLKSIVIKAPSTTNNLQTGQQISLMFKETEVVVGIGEHHEISLQNRIPGKVKSIEQGSLLSKVTIEYSDGEIISIISTNAINQLKLQEQSEVTAMIKLNEVMLSES